MKDTRPEVARMMRQKLMARSNEERFLMGISMCEAARGMVLASFPKDVSASERRRLLRLRYYASAG